MLAGFQRFNAHLGVNGWDRQVDHDIDIRIAEQLIRGASTGNAVFLRLFPSPVQIQISAGRELQNAEFLAVFHINAAYFSTADNAYLHSIHHRTLLLEAALGLSPIAPGLLTVAHTGIIVLRLKCLVAIQRFGLLLAFRCPKQAASHQLSDLRKRDDVCVMPQRVIVDAPDSPALRPNNRHIDGLIQSMWTVCYRKAGCSQHFDRRVDMQIILLAFHREIFHSCDKRT
ncbi:hypothetical protein D3C77_527890 [compost metagenome]